MSDNGQVEILIQQFKGLIQEDQALKNWEEFVTVYMKIEKVKEQLQEIMIADREWFKGLPTDRLVEAYLIPHRMSDEPNEKQMMENDLLEEYLRDHPESLADCRNSGDPSEYPLAFYHVFNLSLFRELQRRHIANENRDGKTVRELLVNKDLQESREGKTSRNPYLDKLRKLVLWVTPSLPDDRGEAGEEEEVKKSIAYGKIAEELREYHLMKAVGLDPKGLEAMVDGRFNKTGWKIRDHVRTALETELKYQNKRVFITPDDVGPDDDGDHTNGEDALESLTAVESFKAAVDVKIFWEQVARSLPPKQQQFLEILLQGHTQAEAASTLCISAARASQLTSEIKKAAKKAHQG